MPVLPLHDVNALRFIPFQAVTALLIGANVLVFLLQSVASEPAFYAAVASFGMRPVEVFGEPRGAVPEYLTLLTNTFMHGDFWHLAGNMLFLWVLGDNVEDALGHPVFLIFYLACGVLASLAEAFADPASSIPVIGASGAVAGVAGAYLMLYPRAQVWALVLGRIPLRLPAMLILGAWIAWQFVMFATGQGAGIALWAHIGGFAAGMALAPILKRRAVRLFGPG